MDPSNRFSNSISHVLASARASLSDPLSRPCTPRETTPQDSEYSGSGRGEGSTSGHRANDYDSIRSSYESIYENHHTTSSFKSNPFMQSKFSSNNNNGIGSYSDDDPIRTHHPQHSNTSDLSPSPNKNRRSYGSENDGEIDTPPSYRRPIIPDTPDTPLSDDDDNDDDSDSVVGVWCVKLETALGSLNDFCCSLPLTSTNPDTSIDSMSSQLSSTTSFDQAIASLEMTISRSISLSEEYLSLLAKAGSGSSSLSSSGGNRGKEMRCQMEKQMERTLRCSSRMIEECDRWRTEDASNATIYSKLAFGSTAAILYLAITFFNNPCSKSTAGSKASEYANNQVYARNDDYLMSYISTACKFVASTKFSSSLAECWFNICAESYLAFLSNNIALIAHTISPNLPSSPNNFVSVINRSSTCIESSVLLVENVTKVLGSSSGKHVLQREVNSKFDENSENERDEIEGSKNSSEGSKNSLSRCSPTILYNKQKYTTLLVTLNKLLSTSILPFHQNSTPTPDQAIEDMLQVLVFNILNMFRVGTSFSEKSLRKHILKAKVIDTLCSTLTGLPDVEHASSGMEKSICCHAPSALAVSRSLGRLSLLEPMRQQINNDPHYVRDLLRLICYWNDKYVMKGWGGSKSGGAGGCDDEDEEAKSTQTILNIILRLSFCLGNLTSSNDNNRKLITLRFGGESCIGSILSGLTACFMREKDVNSQVLLADTLVKFTRLIANICINANAAIQLATSNGIDSLGSLLMVTIENEKEEELLVNVVSCITNLSYYGRLVSENDNTNNENKEGGEGGEGGEEDFLNRNKVFDRREEICGCLVGVLLHDNKQAVVEASRGEQ